MESADGAPVYSDRVVSSATDGSTALQQRGTEDAETGSLAGSESTNLASAVEKSIGVLTIALEVSPLL